MLHQTTRCYTPETRNLDTSCREDLKHHLGLFGLFFYLQNTILPMLVTAEYTQAARLVNPFFKPSKLGHLIVTECRGSGGRQKFESIT